MSWSKRDKIVRKKAKLDAKRKALREKLKLLDIEYQKLQLGCEHWETIYDSGWGRMSDTTCVICGKTL
jgi:hypothetical protein